MEHEYQLIRAKRKTVGITVTPDGSVTVRAPSRLSKKEIDKIVEKHRAWIEKKQTEGRELKKEELSDEDKKLLFCLAEKIIPGRILYFSRITGLVPNKVRISSAEKRFGSCSSKGSVSVSFYVMLYPDKALDLVILHELCHLRHMNHSKDFYALLSSFLPDHKERKALLHPRNRLTMAKIKERYGKNI